MELEDGGWSLGKRTYEDYEGSRRANIILVLKKVMNGCFTISRINKITKNPLDDVVAII